MVTTIAQMASAMIQTQPSRTAHAARKISIVITRILTTQYHISIATTSTISNLKTSRSRSQGRTGFLLTMGRQSVSTSIAPLRRAHISSLHTMRSVEMQKTWRRTRQCSSWYSTIASRVWRSSIWQTSTRYSSRRAMTNSQYILQRIKATSTSHSQLQAHSSVASSASLS